MIGTTIGSYEVVAKLGQGGMGEVYRGRDTRLGRDVAIKIIPAALARDPDRLARFEREAKVLASLNHPHIAQIYGFEGQAIVMELVDGETLADRIRRGPLKPAEALAIARQIADALDAAHEKGIVHRDLKPSNVALTHDGVVKMLDFGLAKDGAPVAGASDLTHSPTMLSPTIAGTLLGTAPYMSPEQARGKMVDKRTDIWAFGCVLYEMLTGARAFGGETTTDTVAAILEREPDWNALPASVTPAVARVLKRCLEKDPKRRLRDIGDLSAQLEEVPPAASTTATAPTPRRLVLVGAVAAVAAVAIIAVALRRWTSTDSALPSTRGVERLTFEAGVSETPALSPDGQLVAYTSDRAGRGDLDIWVQQRGGGSLIRLTDDAADDSSPGFSPDGTQIVFRSERNGGGVYVVPALGGQPRLVVADGRGPRFSPDGTRLAYWTGQFRGEPSGTASKTFVVPLAGGAPLQIAATFAVARDPVWSPDGRGLLFLGRSDRASAVTDSFDVWYAPLSGGEPRRTGLLDINQWRETMIQARTTFGDWSPSGLIVTSGASLWSVPLSADGRITGVARQILLGAGTYRHPAVSRSGQIVFDDVSTERVIQRASLEHPELPPASLFADGTFTTSRTSQTGDGETLVFERVTGARVEIWEKQLRDGATRLLQTVNSSRFINPTVSPDGSRIGFTVSTTGAQSVTVSGNGFVVDRAGGVPRPLCESCGIYEFLSNGRHAVVSVKDAAIQFINVEDRSARDVVVLPPGRIERPSVSPDDRVIAFRRTTQNVAKVFVGAVPPPGGPALTPETAQQIDEPTITGRPAGWSPDSRVLYLLLDTDGHRCLWAQKVDIHGRLDGKPYPARHFHDRESAGISTSLGNAVAPGGFMYETIVVRGNLWLLSQQ